MEDEIKKDEVGTAPAPTPDGQGGTPAPTPPAGMEELVPEEDTTEDEEQKA